MQTTTTLWEEIVADPRFQDLPYKVETNEHGQVILSPHKVSHSFSQGEILLLLRDHLARPGRSAVEFAIDTPKGVKAPDVVWVSEERLAQIPEDAAASPVAPDLVVEVQFAEWTPDAILRAPSYKGQRHDKDPREVVRET